MKQLEDDKLFHHMANEHGLNLLRSELAEITRIAAGAGWIDVNDELPIENETVWLTNDEGWVSLGCLVYIENQWLWALSNGEVYGEGGSIVSECEIEDVENVGISHWHRLPKLKGK